MKEIIDEQQFNFDVLKNKTPTITEFEADWCQPCKVIKSTLLELEHQRQGFDFVTVNVEKLAALAVKYQIKSIPTVVLFKAGRPFRQVIGAVTLQTLVKTLEL